ncbi:Lrp/AsnC family transcriptional regulator [Stygiolobus caldivivus]|uniref:siroheme decarboxylase n=1 Tax=Stygiolobus caldivivus TaxID=2824673 RepID=A0A8D5ZFY9_9CREN|nr:Lrp/AsnC family transcriptional regulator [Stygiolobus caldivivus]BCU70558.1 AsnC family transcriptional regulator [Stygiolobus caldivivus]
MTTLSENAYKIIMELEYNFPFDERPFRVIGERLGINENDVVNTVKELVDKEVIKRIGMYVSFRAKGMESALIASDIPPENLEKFRKIALGIKDLTHNFIRNHPKYNVWYVLKAENRELLNRKIAELMAEVGCKDYVILYSKKSLKLSVKYDVIRGVSYAENQPIHEKIPTAEELGIQKELLRELSYPLPIIERPFQKISEKFNLKESELVELIKELYDKGVIKDYGATINGEKVGITENAMMLINSEDLESSCYNIASKLREATHVVLRESNTSWDYLCYAMIHARNKEIISEVARKALSITNAKSYMLLFSLENLKPGIVI